MDTLSQTRNPYFGAWSNDDEQYQLERIRPEAIQGTPGQSDALRIIRELSLFDLSILWKRAVLNHSYGRIGEVLGCSHEHVRTRYLDLLKRVKKKIEE